MKLCVIAGEISGDLYAAALTKELLIQDPSLVVVGAGGSRLKSIVHEFLFECAHAHAIGIVERFRFKAVMDTFFRTLQSYLETHPIDKVILVDFQHYHLKLAAIFQRFSVPIITYITPNFWIWKDVKRAKKIVSYSEKIIAIFQKEYEFYRDFSPSVYYFGHPYTQLLKPEMPDQQTVVRPSDHGPVISLYPGSRYQEITRLLPTMCGAARIIRSKRPNAKFYLARSSSHFESLIQGILKKSNTEFINSETEDKKRLTQADVMITAAGSATLEAVFYNIPLIILGALSPVTYFLARFIFRVNPEYIGLPNIILGKKGVPEFVQFEINPDRVSEQTLELLRPEIALPLIQIYEKIRQQCAYHPFPITEAAKRILSINQND